MSAAEIIEQIKVLPPEGQAEVCAFVHKLEAEGSEPGKGRYMDPAKAARIADKIFTEHAELFRKLAE